MRLRVGEHPRICLVSASGQNVFFAEIIEAFGEALRERGLTVEESFDCFPAPADDLVCLFIPHEYFPLVHDLAHPSSAQLKRSVALCTEQPGTNWFEISCGIASRAGAVVDINALGAKEMVRRGIDAAHVQMGYVPSWDVWGGDRSRKRDIDMAFLGRHTEQRAKMIARCAQPLERRRAAIYLTETVRPHVVGSNYFLAGQRRAELLANSKILLNIHQQDLPYLEWHRILGAVLNGCVVLSEHSLYTASLEAGTHFVSAQPEDLPLVLTGLLEDPDRLERIRHAAYDRVRSEMPMSDAADILLDAVERAQANPVGQHRNGSPPPPTPMPVQPDRRKPAWEEYADWVGEQLPVRRALKELMTTTRKLERKIGELGHDEPDDNQITVEELGPSLDHPHISVLLTVYNHANLVGEALESVALSEARGVEVIAVDDASTDNSADAVREACSQAPWLTTRLVKSSVNSGLPAAARNLALEHARGELVFVLDADNVVLPNGMGKLVEALEEDPTAAFAYGIVERFDFSGSLGLESWLDWDSERLRYGNFVDAMAMIRREALEAVGGYPTEQVLAGWEDFGLWLAMADAGMHGVRVPDFVGRYRVSQHSMLSSTNVDQSAIWTTMLRKYAILTAVE